MQKNRFKGITSLYLPTEEILKEPEDIESSPRIIGTLQIHIVNPILANVPILYPLKTPENQRFPGIFRGYKMGTLARYGLKDFLIIEKFTS